jgi:hypothetical protein
MLAYRRLLHRLNRVALSLILIGTLDAAFSAPALPVTANPVPFIDIVSPVSVHPGSTGVVLTILGVNFISTSAVKWNGIALTTTYFTAKKLTAAVPNALVAAVGLGAITVVSPTPGGGVSNVVYFPVASAEASTTFPSTPSSSVSAGTGSPTPQGIITADFNADGNLDLAVADSGTNAITVLLGHGDGTFTAKTPQSAGAGANWLATGDFNEDGIPDLAVTNLGSTGAAGVSIFLGNGDGTFTVGTSLTTGSGPFSICAGDFNADGHIDLAIANSGDNTVTVLLGNGNGTFSLSSTPSVGVSPQVIVAGDFNEDGKLDLAVANETDATVTILFGNGLGAFPTQSVVSTAGSGTPIGLIAADLENTGHLDLAAVNASDVAIIRNSPAGTFTLIGNPTTGTGDLIAGVAGDYNGDGNLDIVVSDRTAGEAFLLPGNGNGTFGTKVTFTTASGSFGVATADFNGDGALDLAVANGTANNVSIFLQQLPVSLVPTSLAFGNQLVSTSSSSQQVVLHNNSGSTISSVAITITGADSADYSKTTTCGSSVANLGTCNINVTFTPTAIGSRTATLTVTDTAGNSPQTLALTGTGVASAPAIAKSFGLSTIPLDGSTSLSFTITNGNLIPLTGAGFTDALPSGLLISMPNGLTGSCGGGTITATAGAGSLTLTGATIGASGSCTFGLNITGTAAGAKANTTAAVSSNESGAGATSNTATVTVVAPPVLIKSFGAASVPLNGSTTLTFTAQNNNAGNALTGIGFTDTFPSGLVVATPNGLTGSCGGTITAAAATSSVSLSAATLAASSSCNFSVNVTGITAGARNNTTAAVTSTNGGTGGTASASLAVVAPPTISKAFGAGGVAVNGTTSLSFTITNPAANTVSLTGVAFTDTLPLGIIVATPNGLTGTCGGGTVTATAGSSSASLSGATLAASASCIFSVNVTGTTAGGFTNTTNSVTSTNGGTGNTGSANLSVATPPVITKSFGASTIPLNGSTSLTFAITNPVGSSVSLTGVAFTDSLPSGLVVATPNGLAGSCGGGIITAAAGSGSASLSSATLATSGSCTFSVNVTGTTAGVKNNSVSVTSTNAGAGNTSNASVTVVAPPVLVKAFGAASVPLNGSTTLTFTAQNNNAGIALTGIGFTDTLPPGLVVATPNGLTGTCGGGTITAAAGTGSASLSGATLAASSSCNFSVNVTATTAGAHSNTTGAVTSTNGGAGGTASASLAVVAPPSISKAFGVTNIPPNGTTSLTFTITNPAANTVSLTGVTFTDTLPTNIVVATPNGLTGTCGGGTITATAASGSVSLAGATLAVNTSCTFAVNVTGSVVGNYTNTTGSVSSTNGGTGNTASANLAVNLSAAITSAGSTVFIVGTAGSFTVTTAGSPTPSLSKTGTLPSGVTFADNGNGTAALSGTPAAATGGSYPITITAHNGSGSDAVQNFTLTVNQHATITSAGSTSFTFGTPGTFTVTTTGKPAPTVTVAGSLPPGVTFTDNGNGTATLTGTPAAGSGGIYMFTITASNGVGSSATQSFTFTIAKATPVIAWVTPPAVAYGTPLGATQLDATSMAAGTFVYNPAAGAVLAGGSQTVSVTFTPTDATDYLGATAQVLLLVNPAATTTTVSASPATVPAGAAVTLTAMVSSPAGTPAGTVTFLDGTTSLGAATLSSGAATLATSILAAGPHSIKCTYSASADFGASTSAAVTETITGGSDFTMTSTNGSPDVQSGQPATIPLTLAPQGSFTGLIHFSLTGLPPGASASFSPAILALVGPAIDTLTVTTTPKFNYLSRNTTPRFRSLSAGLLWLPLAGLIFGGASLARKRKDKYSACFLLLALSVTAVMLGGCAGAGLLQHPGTPPGAYQLMITATSANAAHTTVVTLHVQ